MIFSEFHLEFPKSRFHSECFNLMRFHGCGKPKIDSVALANGPDYGPTVEVGVRDDETEIIWLFI